MDHCKFCQSKNIRKNGIVHGNQRFLCKDCHKNQSKYGPHARHHSIEIKIMALKMVKEGIGFRKIGRILGISYVNVLKWVKKSAKIIKENLAKKLEETPAEDIEIVEVDEMWHFLGKKNERFGHGLLLLVPADGFSPSKLALVVEKRAKSSSQDYQNGEFKSLQPTNGKYTNQSSMMISM